MFDLYETILSRELNGNAQNTGSNGIEQRDWTKRRAQMNEVLNTGLIRTKKIAKVEGQINYAIEVVLSVKGAVMFGLQAVQGAAIAWAGVCTALQVRLLILHGTLPEI